MTETLNSERSAITLAQIAELTGGELRNAPNPELPINEIGLRAQELADGGLFAALPGTRVHGAHFATQSAAAAVFTDAEGAEILAQQHASATDSAEPAPVLPVIVVDDVRAQLGTASAAVYNDPSAHLTIIGITGTSGKTTTSYMVESALMAAGVNVGLIGTTGTRINGESYPSHLTTPEAPELQQLFATMVKKGVTHVVMEISSHAIALGRIGGTHIAVAGFTNLSQDHLDFHPTMDDYFATKAQLFVSESSTAAKKQVICLSDGWGVALAKKSSAAETIVNECALPEDIQCDDASAADIRIVDCTVAESGITSATLQTGIGTDEQRIEVPIPGLFNVTNAALALRLIQAVDVAGEFDSTALIRGLAEVRVPGRMERIDAGQDFLAVVDYAHKPGAIAAILDTLRNHVSGRVGIVVGAGGNRDQSKRPLMGAAAARRADLVVVTDDNPRDESPAAIRREVVSGAVGANADECTILNIAHRREAIDAAVAWAHAGDAVVIAGKGHETGQIVGDECYPFDDRKELKAALEALNSESQPAEEK